jgi:DNA-binding CsgD family transcriptional regulator
MLSTRSSLPHLPKRSEIDFPRNLADTDFVSFLIEKAQSLGLEVSLRDSQPKAVEVGPESEHCSRCLEVASRLSSPRDTASDQEIVDWFRGRRKAARTALSILSLRERQVVILVAHGYSNKRAAAVLQVSEKTVEKYRGSACRKLHAQTSAELALLISAADALVGPSTAEESRESSSSRR